MKIVCAKQGRENRTIDENYSAALKEHKAKGGLKSTFPKKEYPCVCTAIVNAKPHKLGKGFDPKNPSYMILCAEAHSCEGPLSPRRGSQSLPYFTIDLAALLHNVTEKSVFLKPSDVGTLMSTNYALQKQALTYNQMYNVKKMTDCLRWGTMQQHFGGLIHMLELLKTYDPDSKIFLKVFPDEVDPVYFENNRKFNYDFEFMKKRKRDAHIFVLQFGAVSITLGSTV